MHYGKLISDLLLQVLFNVFPLRDTLLQCVVQVRNLAFQAVPKIVNCVCTLLGFLDDVVLERLRSVFDKLPKLIIDGLLSVDLLSYHICNSSLQSVKLLGLDFDHLLTLTLLLVDLLAHLVEQVCNCLELLLGLTLLGVKPVF